MLIEQLRCKPIYTRLTAKLLKPLIGLSNYEHLNPKLLKMLTSRFHLSTLAETPMNTGIRLSCSVSILDEHLCSCGSFLGSPFKGNSNPGFSPVTLG